MRACAQSPLHQIALGKARFSRGGRARTARSTKNRAARGHARAWRRAQHFFFAAIHPPRESVEGEVGRSGVLILAATILRDDPLGDARKARPCWPGQCRSCCIIAKSEVACTSCLLSTRRSGGCKRRWLMMKKKQLSAMGIVEGWTMNAAQTYGGRARSLALLTSKADHTKNKKLHAPELLLKASPYPHWHHITIAVVSGTTQHRTWHILSISSATKVKLDRALHH